MKIALLAKVFYPRIGGIEEVTRLYAEGFSNLGHEVTVYTDEEASSDYDVNFRFAVERLSAFSGIVECLKKSDLAIIMGPAVSYLLASKLANVNTIVTHHVPFPEANGSIKTIVSNGIKKLLLRYSENVYVSEFLRSRMQGDGRVVQNPIDLAALTPQRTEHKDKDVVFVGRLVPEKGAIYLLEAVSEVRARGRTLRVTFVGDGPERSTLQTKSNKLGLTEHVDFVGGLGRSRLAEVVSSHKILVVPSVWEEPFGLVVLEGLALGCGVIVSRSGALPHVLSRFGETVRVADSIDLADKITSLLDGGRNKWSDQEVSNYLQGFTAETVCRRLLLPT